MASLPATGIAAVAFLFATTAAFGQQIAVSVVSDSKAASGGAFFSVVDGDSAALSGTNSVAGVTRIDVNGDSSAFDAMSGAWSKTNSLRAGVNHHFIAALDDSGNLRASTNRMIVSKSKVTTTGGVLGETTVWSPAMGVIEVTNIVVIPAGGTLTIEAGTTVLMKPRANIVGTNATLVAAGAREFPIYFLPADGTSTSWGGLSIAGTNGAMTLEHVETIAGYVQLLSGATGNLRDSYFHDYLGANPPIIYTLGDLNNPVTLNMDRCHIANYHEILTRVTTNRISDCLLEYLDYSGDGIDFDHGLEGSVIRRCTVRRGTIFNTDAIDMGEWGPNGTRVTIDSCLLHDFIDKGVSMGVGVTVTVTNTLIYNVDAGFGVKDNSVASLFNCTVANANFGINAYNKANAAAASGGGHVTNSLNNIFWNITNAAVSLKNGSTLVATYSDFFGMTVAGVGNISSDPLFVDGAARDYRLAGESPVLGAGLNGANMGVTFPVGGIPAAPLRVAAVKTHGDAPTIVWTDDADNESEFVIERATSPGSWAVVGAVPANATAFKDWAAPYQKSYYRVVARNGSGVSAYSNVASATHLLDIAPSIVDGGVVIRFPGFRGLTYSIEYKTDLNETTWTKLTEITAGTFGAVELEDSAPQRSGARYYRISVSSL